VVKFVFSHSKLRKQPFSENFKIQGVQVPVSPFRRPWRRMNAGEPKSQNNVTGTFFNTVIYIYFRKCEGFRLKCIVVT